MGCGSCVPLAGKAWPLGRLSFALRRWAFQAPSLEVRTRMWIINNIHSPYFLELFLLGGQPNFLVPSQVKVPILVHPVFIYVLPCGLIFLNPPPPFKSHVSIYVHTYRILGDASAFSQGKLCLKPERKERKKQKEKKIFK